MKLLPRLVGLCALSISTAVTAAPVINSVITSYSASGVPNSITIFGTGLCAATNCSTKPAVTLGGAVLSPVSGSVTGIVAPLGLISDGDYVLKLTAGSSSTTYNLTIKSNSSAGGGTTISVGSTVTGASGTAASVTNTGTSTAAVLNFVVPQGPVGPQGPIGNTGPQGLQGIAGLPGQQGQQGLKGDTGATGPAGAQGPVGPTGPEGPMGLPGLKGDKGDKGDTGAPGATGPTGPQGPTGVAPGNVFGDLLYWNGMAWTRLAPPTVTDVGLRYCGGIPQWVNSCSEILGPVLFEEQFNSAVTNNWIPVTDHFPMVGSGVNQLLVPSVFTYSADGKSLLIRRTSTTQRTGTYSESESIFGTGIELVSRVKTMPAETKIAEVQFVAYIVNADTGVAVAGAALHYGCFKACKMFLASSSQGIVNNPLAWAWDTWYVIKISDTVADGLVIGLFDDAGTQLFQQKLGVPLSAVGTRFRIGFGTWAGDDGDSIQTSLVDYIRVCRGKC